ncbi:hypothetical protein KC19_VG210700 [Ceratodon purpureus]|uniref:Protein DGCR14 n=1 Tax=Ceratodon purpureus TaxID=3225 RepID=A0A8T0HSJ8_CERPU|nr:hypothetical protein KC19_VG210700 [Ceratodon purpureus]
MLGSPGRSPRLSIPPSPSPSPDSRGSYGALASASTSDRALGLSTFPKKRKSSQIPLDEDTYVAAIEKIIERDFFPDIPKLRNRLEWLEAVRSGDPVIIRDAQMNIVRRRREKAREDGERDGTPVTDVPDTPASMISGLASPAVSLRSAASPRVFLPSGVAHEKEDGPAVNTNLKLDDFLRKYTSEDNASFSKILEKGNKQQQQRYEFLSEKGLVDPNLRIGDANDRVTDGYGTSNQPFATLDTWKYRAKNLLMYDSAEREDAPLMQAEKEELVEGAPKAISMRNTRFHGKMFDSKVREEDTVAILYTPVAGGTPQAWSFAQRDADRGRKKYDLEDLRKTPQALDSQLEGAGHPGAGYSYVATPSPAPGVDESPFMTWGEIEGTPLRLETEDTPVDIGGVGGGPHFKIPAPPTRDVRAHALSRDAARSLREKVKFHSPRFSPSPARGSGQASPVPGLSVAAQKFVNKAMAKSSSSVDARLRASYGAGASPGSPRMAGTFLRSRQGSVLGQEDSLPLRSPSVPRSMP